MVPTATVLVVLIVADSVRADAPGFGGGEACTPMLDLMAEQGVVFEHCCCSGAWTVPSLVAIATGTFPHRVGVARWRHPFPMRRPTLMSAFAAAGFEVRTMVHNPRFALAATCHRGVAGDSEDPDSVVQALRTPPGADRLVLVHHWWTHLPYVASKLPKKRWKQSCDLEIEALGRDPEDAVPRLRGAYHDALGWFDRVLVDRYLEAATSGGGDVLVAVTADHGETWGDSLPEGRKVEHMYDLHGRWMTDETTLVPLLIWGRGATGPIPECRRIGGLARGVDVAPTLCDLAGVPWPGPCPETSSPTLIDRGIGPAGEGLVLDGVSLAGRVLGDAPPSTREALTVTSHNAIVPASYPLSGLRMWSRFGLRTEDRRYTWDGLYRIREAMETKPVAECGRLARMKDRYLDLPRVWARLANERSVAVGPGERLSRELFEPAGDAADADGDGDLDGQMRMLGYSAD